MNLTSIATKARESSFHRWLLSKALNTIVPFNGPHKFKVIEIGPTELKVGLPYRKRNLNHLKGIHACALATLAEVSSGFLLISILDPKKYRLILKKLEMEYHYQAKTDVQVHFRVDDSWLQSAVIKPLEAEGMVMISPKIEIMDSKGNHIATGTAHWQIKRWDMVKTKV